MLFLYRYNFSGDSTAEQVLSMLPHWFVSSLLVTTQYSVPHQPMLQPWCATPWRLQLLRGTAAVACGGSCTLPDGGHVGILLVFVSEPHGIWIGERRCFCARARFGVGMCPSQACVPAFSLVLACALGRLLLLIHSKFVVFVSSKQYSI